MRLYKNGQLVGERDSTYSSVPGGGDFWLARGATSGYFDGKIGDVKVYSRALSGTEIAQQHVAGRGGEVAAQTYNTASVNFTMDGNARAVAEYQVSRRKFEVVSTPVAGASVTGTVAGTTDYSGWADDDATVTLTAPTSFTANGTTYAFLRWKVYREQNLAGRYLQYAPSGVTATDTSGNGNDGTIQGAETPQWTDGGLVLDGVDDCVSCPGDSFLNLDGPMTVSAWVCPVATFATSGEFGLAGKHFSQYLLTYYTSNYCAYWYGNWENLHTSVTHRRFHLDATGRCVFDNSSSPAKLRLYKNGAFIAEMNSSCETGVAGFPRLLDRPAFRRRVLRGQAFGCEGLLARSQRHGYPDALQHGALATTC